MTDAGQAAAALLLQIPINDLFVVAPPTPPEVLEAARNKALAKNVLRILTFNGGRIRGSQVKFTGGRDFLVAGFAGPYRSPLSADVMALIRPHREPFIDIDGNESLRITEVGIAATARPKRKQRTLPNR